ncbi:potassium channel subfamily K member 5a [Carcharodon carcharias]|uniref:potassium channel subfamily K member 5a n=1 Tax=Carcharodon carcharias TaxID=13397 RepID=UPI001B7E2255|nr:potassium channel subfamily K member 5a [Carcharodon carcharias]XP_041044807.1 potassium channel subfamily K member 5a [Carcharodon carcharias]
MVDRGPLLTSAIIFYLSIGAAIFQVLEEPNWTDAARRYELQKSQILKDHPCLTHAALEKILETVEEAAGQGVTITGNKTFNNWNWPNAVIFAATVITTIGYGNIAPKTSQGRLFCIFYGLFGTPLCLSWISALGKFFGGRAKKLGEALTRKGMSPRKAQITCTAIFIVWGVLVHLVMPPFVFMVTEGWSYIEGLYYSFITISTIGFGDFVAGVNPNADYHILYRYFVELWIYLGLAWLSLFFNWKVSMFVQAHKAIKKRRKRMRESVLNVSNTQPLNSKMSDSKVSDSTEVNIFRFLSKKQESYNDLIKQIGSKTLKNNSSKLLGVQVPAKPTTKDESKGKPGAVQLRKIGLRRFCYEPPNLPVIDDTEITVPLSEGKDLNTQPDCTTQENQLDKTAREDCSVWDTRARPPLFFENVNIRFIDEQNLLSDDEKVELSLDENLVNEGESDDPVLTPDTVCSDFQTCKLGSPPDYEQLMNGYNKVHNKVHNVEVVI